MNIIINLRTKDMNNEFLYLHYRQHVCELCSSPVYNFHTFMEHVKSSVHLEKLSKVASKFKEKLTLTGR